LTSTLSAVRVSLEFGVDGSTQGPVQPLAVSTLKQDPASIVALSPAPQLFGKAAKYPDP
jgi:hypothetical protein